MMNIQNYSWVIKALHFWQNTTPAQCGKSRKIIRWNIEILTEAKAKLERLTDEKGPLYAGL